MSDRPLDLSLLDFLDALSKRKVSHYHCDSFTVDFSPLAFAAPEPAEGSKTVAQALASDICACGHDIAVEHAESGCLRGCPLEKCGEPTKP